jgi:transposase
MADRRPLTARSTLGAMPWSAAWHRLKRHCGMATRYDKLAAHYLATLHIVAINEWLRPDL